MSRAGDQHGGKSGGRKDMGNFTELKEGKSKTWEAVRCRAGEISKSSMKTKRKFKDRIRSSIMTSFLCVSIIYVHVNTHSHVYTHIHRLYESVYMWHLSAS